MFDFFYNKLLKNCPSKIEIGMSDTDSLLFSVTKPNLFWKHLDKHMDYSNFPQNHPKFSNKNKSKLGYFKNELAGKKCKKFIGLRPKCYAMLVKDENLIKEKKVCKGLGKTAIDKRLKFAEYENCLENKQIVRHNFAAIRSKKHKLSTIIQRKKALSYFCSKRYLYPCGIHSSPYNSILINLFENQCPFCNINNMK